MPKAVLALCTLLLALSIDGSADRAAMAFASPLEASAQDSGLVQAVRFDCRCAQAWAPAWAPRKYWQWDSRPIWDDPWRVLRPNFWGSPEPHRVPADIWACKWHLPPAHDWRRHRRQCRAWQ